MIASIAFNYFIGKYVFGNRTILSFGILINIILIAYFKYSYFIFENINHLASISLPFNQVVLPLGISFFTFQQIAYLVDSYHGNRAENNIVAYALLVSFFPHSIAGPLVQYKEILPQFKESRLSIDNLTIGISIFVIGLFKKVIIADGLAPCANAVFDAASSGIIPSFSESWFASICYTLQLYFDFSGYSDMALGLAKVFNIRFPFNFNSPYKSTSIIDFWRRWHITLSDFLKNYLYIPLGGSRSSILARYRNLLLVMLIGGLWHGASWTFVLWGLLHGVYLVINHIWRDFCKARKIIFTTKKYYFIFSWALTIFCIISAWVLFRAPNLKVAMIFYKSMFCFYNISVSPIFDGILPNLSFINYKGFFSNKIFYYGDFLPSMILSILICLCFPNIKGIFKNFLDSKENCSSEKFQESSIISINWAPSKTYAVVICIMTVWIMIVLLSQRKVDFLYFNF